MKICIIVLLLLSNLSANILFIGSSNDKFSCDGKEYSPTKMLNCSNIKAITNISFCYFQNSNLGCKKLYKNESFSIASIDESPINFKRLLGFNKVEQTSFGIKRFGDEIEKTHLIPNGTILKPNANLNISIVSKNKQDTFTIYSNNKIIFKSTIKNNTVVIPKSKFKYGKEYKWTLSDQENTYKGSFDVLDNDYQQQMNKEIKILTSGINNEKSIKIIISIVYDQYGLKYDRYIILKEIL